MESYSKINENANMCYKRKQYEKAVKLWKQIEDTDRAGLWHKIGLAYEKLENYDMALAYCMKSHELRKSSSSLAFNDVYMATLLNNIGFIYAKQKRYDEALAFYSDSLELLRTLVPWDHIYVAQSLNNIASVRYDQGEYELALIDLEEARLIAVRHEALNSDYARILNNIGSVYNKLGHYEIALEYFKKSCRVSKKLKMISNPTSRINYDLASAMNNIGNLYYENGRRDKALKYFFKSFLEKGRFDSFAGHVRLVCENKHDSYERLM